MQRACVRGHYICAMPRPRPLSRTRPYTTCTKHPPMRRPVTVAPAARHPCVLKSYARCDFRPASLCFRECNNTIVLKLKTNSSQKGYSLNTHKPKQTQHRIKSFYIPARAQQIIFTSPRRRGILRASGIQQPSPSSRWPAAINQENNRDNVFGK